MYKIAKLTFEAADGAQKNGQLQEQVENCFSALINQGRVAEYFLMQQDGALVAIASLPEEEKKKAVKDFNFTKGIIVALLAGFMSACFNIGLGFGADLNFGADTDPMFMTLPATLLVTTGGFVTNAVYCFYQNSKNHTWGDYSQTRLYANNVVFCALAGLLWYSQFFGLSLGKGFLTGSAVLMTFSWCILMALNVTFSNVWGIILKEWKGCSQKTIAVLVAGLVILIVSSFLPQLLK